MPPPIDYLENPMWVRRTDLNPRVLPIGPAGPAGPGGRIPDVMLEARLRAAKRARAEREIARRWEQMGGSPGPALLAGDDGLVDIGAGFARAYEKGRIYYRAGFEPVHVYGAIGERYAQLDGPAGWLGWPTTSPDPKLTPAEQAALPDEQPFAQDGRVSTFENGAIYWWEDTGAIELGQICVRYTGLACFSATSGGGSDEPYVILGMVPTPPLAPSQTRTMIHEDVDGGDSREADIELYRGLPYGLALSAVLMEHDTGNPDEYREVVKSSVSEASKKIVEGVGAIPVVGVYLAVAAAVVLEVFGPDITDAINDLLGTDDDYVGNVAFVVTAKQMVTLARAEPKNFRGIRWHLDSPLISGDGADYKVYVSISAV